MRRDSLDRGLGALGIAFLIGILFNYPAYSRWQTRPAVRWRAFCAQLKPVSNCDPQPDGHVAPPAELN